MKSLPKVDMLLSSKNTGWTWCTEHYIDIFPVYVVLLNHLSFLEYLWLTLLTNITAQHRTSLCSITMLVHVFTSANEILILIISSKIQLSHVNMLLSDRFVIYCFYYFVWLCVCVVELCWITNWTKWETAAGPETPKSPRFPPYFGQLFFCSLQIYIEISTDEQ